MTQEEIKYVLRINLKQGTNKLVIHESDIPIIYRSLYSLHLKSKIGMLDKIQNAYANLFSAATGNYRQCIGDCMLILKTQMNLLESELSKLEKE